MHNGPNFSLTREQVQDLGDLAGDLHNEAQLCSEAGCWRAALLLVSSALEAALLATVCCFEPELRQRRLLLQKRPHAVAP